MPDRLSILVPLRNAEGYIARTLESLLSQPALDAAKDEIVIIEDGSTDNSREIVETTARKDRRCPIRIIDGPRAGISAAMNAGIAAAKGQWIGRCDADDLWSPGRVRLQLELIERHSDFGAVCGRFRTITSKGRPIADMSTGDTSEEITAELRTGVVRTHLGTFLIRADLLKQTGFRPWFVTAEDVDIQLRLGEICRVWYDSTIVYEYRLHDGSITHQQADTRRNFYDSTAKQFSVQRRETGSDALQRGQPPEPPALVAGAAPPLAASRQVQQVLIGKSWKHHQSGQRLKAVLTGLRACMMSPNNVNAWKSLGALALTSRRKAEGNG